MIKTVWSSVLSNLVAMGSKRPPGEVKKQVVLGASGGSKAQPPLFFE